MKDLYFILNPTNNTVKIGVSQDPKSRLKSIKYIGGNKEARILHTIPEKSNYEKIFHKIFKEYNAIMEWYEYTGIVKSYIQHLVKNKNNVSYEKDFAVICVINDVFGKFSDFYSFDDLIKKTKRAHNSINEIYDQIIDERKDIGWGVKKPLWEFLYYKNLNFKYSNYSLFFKGGQYSYSRRDNPWNKAGEEQILQIKNQKLLNYSDDYYYNLALENEPELNIIESNHFENLTNNQKKEMLSYSNYCYVDYGSGEGLILGINKDYNAQLHLKLYCNNSKEHFEYLNYLYSYGKMEKLFKFS